MSAEAITAKRAVLYLRVSSDRQTKTAGDGKGFSIHAQQKRCEQKADEIDATVVETYVELAESAKSAKRPELQRMLSRIRNKGDVDCIILFKVDRFARNRTDDALMMHELREHGVQLISATENIDSTPEGQMMHGILATFAEYEILRNAVRTKSGMDQKAKMGGTPARPRWDTSTPPPLHQMVRSTAPSRLITSALRTFAGRFGPMPPADTASMKSLRCSTVEASRQNLANAAGHLCQSRRPRLGGCSEIRTTSER